MDDREFDALARAVAHGTMRRQVLKAITGGGVVGLVAAFGPHGAAADICREAGVLCAKDAQCCSGVCDPDTHR